ncbi:DUF4878 domain-containing protein [Candidatus Poribacteria bacterium]|nr:DUF4878 domain-containing protein [Candidatus Poribacteria bacterium]
MKIPKLHLVVCLICIVVLLFSSCARRPRKPADVTRTLYTAIYADGNVKLAREYSSQKVLSLAIKDYGSVENWIKAIHKSKVDNDFNLTEVEILEEDIEDNQAKLRIRLHDKGGKTEYEDVDLVKENGRWKVTVNL